MRKNNKSYPYPVLGNNDDYNVKLDKNSISITNTKDKRCYNFSIELLLENERIQELIDEGYAEFTCEITCPRTYYRRCEHSEVAGFSFDVARKDVYGEMHLECYVTVKEDIIDYRNDDFNEDYEDALFDLEPGDILVKYPPMKYVAELKYEKLYSAGSIMVVLETDKDAVWYDSNTDKIIVYLPKPMFAQFKTLSTQNEFNEMFHASIVFNALVQSLIQYNPKEQSHLKWAQTIQYRLDTEENLKDFSLENKSQMFELAQTLLGDPYRRLFNKLELQTATEPENEEE